ncbi:MAG: DUF4150 domain-containing protein [Nitrospiraceae bacterium]|nr:MAG: DUF4150 domain-containing protein [Nitrospiraceae bacterium]
MGNDVFANGREVSCKAADGKSICAFPDVCMTPPENPATPPGVPIPYPNTGMASDMTEGSKNVKVSGKEVMLKNKSYFKKSTGDEAGAAAKKGVVTSTNTGKVYFTSWSMDVKFEGENVVRHLDMTTHNHMCSATPPNTPPWMYIDSMAIAPPGHPCKDEIDNAQKKCGKPSRKQVGGRMHRICDEEGKCENAMGCILVPKGKDKEMCCSPDNTGHHLIEDHWIRPGGELVDDFKFLGEKEGGNYKKPGGPYDGAPTMCANKSRYHGKHGIAHGTGGVLEETFIGKDFTYADGKKIAVSAQKDAYPDSGCSQKCIESQLDSFYNDDGNKKCHSPDKKQPMKEEQRQAAITRVFGEDTM